jgi:hypothetical protein
MEELSADNFAPSGAGSRNHQSICSYEHIFQRLERVKIGETLLSEGNKISPRYSLRGSPRSCATADPFRRVRGPEAVWIRQS